MWYRLTPAEQGQAFEEIKVAFQDGPAGKESSMQAGAQKYVSKYGSSSKDEFIAKLSTADGGDATRGAMTMLDRWIKVAGERDNLALRPLRG